MSTLIEENSNDLGAVFGEPLQTVVVIIRSWFFSRIDPHQYCFEVVLHVRMIGQFQFCNATTELQNTVDILVSTCTIREIQYCMDQDSVSRSVVPILAS